MEQSSLDMSVDMYFGMKTFKGYFFLRDTYQTHYLSEITVCMVDFILINYYLLS